MMPFCALLKKRKIDLSVLFWDKVVFNRSVFEVFRQTTKWRRLQKPDLISRIYHQKEDMLRSLSNEFLLSRSWRVSWIPQLVLMPSYSSKFRLFWHSIYSSCNIKIILLNFYLEVWFHINMKYFRSVVVGSLYCLPNRCPHLHETCPESRKET